MATIKQVYSVSDSTVTISLNSLAADGTVTSSAIDNTSDKFINFEFEIELTGGNALSTELVDYYLLRSNDNTNYTTVGNDPYIDKIASIRCNGTTLVRRLVRVGQIPAYSKVYAVNRDSTYALGASGNSVSYRGVDLSNT